MSNANLSGLVGPSSISQSPDIRSMPTGMPMSKAHHIAATRHSAFDGQNAGLEAGCPGVCMGEEENEYPRAPIAVGF